MYDRSNQLFITIIFYVIQIYGSNGNWYWYIGNFMEFPVASFPNFDTSVQTNSSAIANEEYTWIRSISKRSGFES